MTNQLQSQVVSLSLNLLIWIVSLLIATFYLLQSLGWIYSNFMAFNGMLGEKGEALMHGFSTVDHIMRVLQVIVLCTASILLLLQKRFAFNLFLCSLGLGFLCTLLLDSWSVSFLGGYGPLAILATATAIVYWMFTSSAFNSRSKFVFVLIVLGLIICLLYTSDAADE